MKIHLHSAFALGLACILSACSPWKVSTGDYESIDKISAVELKKIIGENLQANNIHNLAAYGAKAARCNDPSLMQKADTSALQRMDVKYATQDGVANLMQIEAMQIVEDIFATTVPTGDVHGKVTGFAEKPAASRPAALTYTRIKALHDALEKSSTTNSLLFYETAYYQGKFVTRFGDKLGNPKFDSGIDDTALNHGFLVMLELAADLYMRTPVIHAAGGKVYPGTKEVPTVFEAGEKKVADLDKLQKLAIVTSGCGITENEAKLIRTLSNKVADQVTKRSAGLLEALHSVDVGFAVLPNFAIGSNETLMLLAKTLIEVSARRATQHLLTEAFLEHDIDIKLPD